MADPHNIAARLKVIEQKRQVLRLKEELNAEEAELLKLQAEQNVANGPAAYPTQQPAGLPPRPASRVSLLPPFQTPEASVISEDAKPVLDDPDIIKTEPDTFTERRKSVAPTSRQPTGPLVDLLTPSAPPVLETRRPAIPQAVHRRQHEDAVGSQSDTAEPTRKKHKPFDAYPTLNDDPTYSTVVSNADRDGYVELRCCVCQGNTKGIGTRVVLFKGVLGFTNHLKQSHPDQYPSNAKLRSEQVLNDCFHKRLSQAEVDAVLRRDKKKFYSIPLVPARKSEAPVSYKRRRSKTSTMEDSTAIAEQPSFRRKTMNSGNKKYRWSSRMNSDRLLFDAESPDGAKRTRRRSSSGSDAEGSDDVPLRKKSRQTVQGSPSQGKVARKTAPPLGSPVN